MIHDNPILSGSVLISGSLYVQGLSIVSASQQIDLGNATGQAVSSSNANTSSVVHNEYVSSGSLNFWSGPKTAYDAISGSADENTLYFIVE